MRYRDAERLWNEEHTRRFPARLRKPVLEKLQMLNAAAGLTDLLAPPGNRLEALREDRLGQHCIRINDQYCICFEWRDNNAYNVEITDYL